MQVVICTDVVLVCLVKGHGESICELLFPPLERGDLTVEQVLSKSEERPCFTLTQGPTTVVLEAKSVIDRSIWMQMLRDRSSYTPTSRLRGPRLVPFTCSTRKDIMHWLGLPDPFLAEGQTLLEREWQTIPRVSSRWQ